MPIVLLAVLVLPFLFWLRIEMLNGAKSRGFMVSLFGCILFSGGLFANSAGWDKYFAFTLVAIGLFMALHGTARFIVDQFERVNS